MTVIEANNLSKTYTITGKLKSSFEALSNITFRIKEAEAVGIIGSNGAGKSTLLKILAGVTLPTKGSAKISGSFSSLLEVGTGFHPDLSGRDNIYLNASILGISKKEVSTEIQKVIQFSGVEKFIDQPLRTYSSGMKLRLAFSIIAHLKTDIIALDEVLAVGDSMFQIKCIERIFEFKNEGKTILFVSHNLSAIRKLCQRTLVLQQGKITFDGKTDEAIKFYLSSNHNPDSKLNSDFIQYIKNHCLEKDATLKIKLANIPSDNNLDIGVNITTLDGVSIYHFSNRFILKTLTPVNGKLKINLKFEHRLKPGCYFISIYIGQNEQQLEWSENVSQLQIPPYNPYNFHNPEAIQSSVITEFEINTD